MKKMIAVLALFSILFSFAACQTKDQVKFDIAETKKIKLGDEVSSVVLVTAEGEKITCNSGADFYEIFNKVSMPSEISEKHSYVGETKLGDDSKSFSNMNVYYLTKGQLVETTTKKEGEEDFSVIEEYNYYQYSPDQPVEMRSFVKYMYKEELAFGGSERDANGYKVYSSDAYPILPQAGTELGEMHVRSSYLQKLMPLSELFQSYEPYDMNGKTYDFEQFVTREYTLYENYIVFKQTAPFIHLKMGIGYDLDILLAQFSNTDYSITQEAYCNVKTGEIEFIKVYGNTLWYTPEYNGRKMAINVEIYIHDVKESESEQKLNALIEYVKSNVESNTDSNTD